MNDIELNRAARDVIQAGRDGVAPNEFTAERIRRSVARALDGSSPPVRSRNRTLPILVALGAAGLAGALYATELVRSSKSEPPAAKLAPVAPPQVARPTLGGLAGVGLAAAGIALAMSGRAALPAQAEIGQRPVEAAGGAEFESIGERGGWHDIAPGVSGSGKSR